MDKQTLARTITALIIAILDLTHLLGIDFSLNDNDIYTFVLAIISVIYAIRIYWKNNNITIEARTAQHVLDELKGKHDADAEFIESELFNVLDDDGSTSENE